MSEETETPKPADVAGRLDGLVSRLRSLARFEHDDFSVATEAADEIERLHSALKAISLWDCSGDALRDVYDKVFGAGEWEELFSAANEELSGPL
ncbi:MAG TPA: hypothetical protein VJ396_07905 [Acidiferrobacterales bacterium]|nr:hypothetical protein [Acidiferrobacterales bacterium]